MRRLGILSARVAFGCVVGLAVASLPSCGPDEEGLNGCYPEEVYPPMYDGPVNISEGYCTWKRSEIPTDYAADGEGGDDFQVCVDLEAGQACDACPAAETDDLIRRTYETQCGKELLGFRRGCVVQRDDGRCCYKALVSPPCDDPIH